MPSWRHWGWAFTSSRHIRSIGYIMELAVWKAGVVMGRDTWNLNISLMVYLHMVYETLNKCVMLPLYAMNDM
ncbi:hypothetical protein HanIR_Chr13g0656121 [Helianthus annuus]|nr:hypothetical protein HanIR_Chr13g0656121 [Helianthus annuus]